MEEELEGSVDLSSMAATYIKIRDKRNDLRRAYEADDVTLANDMKVLESEM